MIELLSCHICIYSTKNYDKEIELDIFRFDKPTVSCRKDSPIGYRFSNILHHTAYPAASKLLIFFFVYSDDNWSPSYQHRG